MYKEITLKEKSYENFKKWQKSVGEKLNNQQNVAVKNLLQSAQQNNVTEDITKGILKMHYGNNNDKNACFMTYDIVLPHNVDQNKSIKSFFKLSATSLTIKQSVLTNNDLLNNSAQEESLNFLYLKTFNGFQINQINDNYSSITLMINGAEELLPLLLSNKDVVKFVSLLDNLF
jgi:hypothetical protein